MKGPWAFDGSILLVKRWKGTEQLSELMFSEVRFWFKAYDVLAVWQTKTFREFLGSKIDSFAGYDDDLVFGEDRSLCFRIDVNVGKPLRWGINVRMEGKQIWIYFKYLKLPDFCYGRGKLGHTLKASEDVDPDTPASTLQYGAWLRGLPFKTRRRNVELELHEKRKLFIAFRNNKSQ